MSAYLVRIEGDEGHDYGVFIASSLRDLFWAIDEWADPYQFEYRRLRRGVWFCSGNIGTQDEVPGLGLSERDIDAKDLRHDAIYPDEPETDLVWTPVTNGMLA